MGFPRQEYWIRWPFLSPRDLPDPGIEAGSPAMQADSLPSEPPGKPDKAVRGLVQVLAAGPGGGRVKASPGRFQAHWWCSLLPSVVVLGQSGQA